MATSNDIFNELKTISNLGNLQINALKGIQATLSFQALLIHPPGGNATQNAAQALAGGTGGGSQSRPQKLAKTRIGRFVQNVRPRIKGGRSAGRNLGVGIARKLGMSRPAQASIGRAAGVAGGAIGALTGLVAGFLEAKKAVSEWTNEALESKRKFAEINGEFAAIFLEREIRDRMRDMQSAQNTSESSRKLMESEARRKDASRPISDALDNVWNEALTFFNDALSTVMEGINEGLKFLGLLEDKKVEPQGIVGMMPDVMKEMDRIEKQAKELMDKAKAAADRAGFGGFAAPAGAAPPGKIGI